MTKTTYVVRNGQLVVKRPLPEPMPSEAALYAQAAQAIQQAARDYDDAIFRALLTPLYQQPVIIFDYTPMNRSGPNWVAEALKRNPDEPRFRDLYEQHWPPEPDAGPPERRSEEPAPRPRPLKPWRWGDV